MIWLIAGIAWVVIATFLCGTVDRMEYEPWVPALIIALCPLALLWTVGVLIYLFGIKAGYWMDRLKSAGR